MKYELKMMNEKKTLINKPFDAVNIEDAWRKAKNMAASFMAKKGMTMIKDFEENNDIAAVFNKKQKIEMEEVSGDVTLKFKLIQSDSSGEVQPTTEELLLYSLDQWKFENALKYLEAQPKEIVETIELLSRMFGNTGYFQGDMSKLVSHTINDIKNQIK